MSKSQAHIAKLSAPRLASALRRQRLFDRLNALRTHPAVWVCGPAGSGKTMLVASWLRASRKKSFWYSVDEGDRDVASVFGYLGALGSQFGVMRASAVPEFASGHNAELRSYARGFFRHWFSRLPRGAVLVIDNHHEVEGSEFDELLKLAIAEMPSHGQMIVISRSDVPRKLLRDLAADRLGRVGWDDLRFTQSETAQLIALCGLNAGSSARRLHALSDGWAAGIVLMSAIPDLRTSDSSGTIGEGPQAVFAYFAEEVIERLRSKDRDLLLRTSYFPQFTANMARRITGHPRAESVLDSLHGNHYFTERRLATFAEYRYHDLFRAFLQDRTRKVLGQAAWRELLEQAATLLMERGESESAAALLCQAQSWSNFIRLAQDEAAVMLARGRWRTFLGWVDALPTDLAGSYPWLMYWNGRAHAAANPPKGRALLELAFDAFKAVDDLEGMVVSCGAIMDTYFQDWNLGEPLDRWIDILIKLIEIQRPLGEESRGSAMVALATAMVFRQPSNRALPGLISEIEARLARISDVNQRVINTALLVDYYSLMGRMSDCDALFERTSTDPEDDSCMPVNRFLWWRSAGNVSYRKGHLNAAKAHFQRALQFARRDGLVSQTYVALFSVAVAEASDGHLSEAKKLMGSLRKRLDPRQLVHVIAYHYLEFWLAILGEDRDQALIVWELFSRVPVAGVPINTAYNHAVIHFLVAAGAGEIALDRVQRWRADLVQMQSPLLNFNLLVMQAYVQLKLGMTEAAIQSLSECFALGAAHGFTTTLTWLPDMMSELCAAAHTAGVELDYVSHLIRSRSLRPPRDHPVRWPTSIRIKTLGTFVLERDDQIVEFARKTPRKPLALLKTIIVSGRTGLPVRKAEDWLWPSLQGDAATQALTTALSRLRRVLGHRDCVILSNSVLRMNEDLVWIDAHEFDRLAQDEATYDAALSLYGGEFLPSDQGETWSITARDRMRSRFVALVEHHGQRLERLNKFAQALECYERGIEADPLAESLDPGLMRAHAAQGRLAEGAAAYRRLRQTLSVLLGRAPSSKSVQLGKLLLDDQPQGNA